MARTGTERPLRLAALGALVALETRALLRNRAACAVLLLALVAAGSLRLGRDRLDLAAAETCYIVYWQRDAWVRRLESAVERENPDGLAIRVVHVGELADREGTIRYPPRAHSIQLRPAADGPGRPKPATTNEPTWPVSTDGQQTDAAGDAPHERWTVWFWHSGRDPAALWPYSQWFWRVTAGHFGRSVEFEPRISPLRPEAAVAGRVLSLSLASLGGPAFLEIGLVWMVVFFAACHLAGQSLAEARMLRTIESLAVTPAGWRGAALARRLCYGGAATILAAAVTAILRPAALASGAFWLGLAAATFAGLGIAFVAGAWCRSAASAGAASVLYVLFAGALFAATGGLSDPSSIGWPAALSFENSLLGVWRAAWDGSRQVTWPAAASLLVWGLAWHTLGTWSMRVRGCGEAMRR